MLQHLDGLIATCDPEPFTAPHLDDEVPAWNRKGAHTSWNVLQRRKHAAIWLLALNAPQTERGG